MILIFNRRRCIKRKASAFKHEETDFFNIETASPGMHAISMRAIEANVPRMGKTARTIINQQRHHPGFIVIAVKSGYCQIANCQWHFKG